MNIRNLLMPLILISASDLIVRSTAQCPKITHVDLTGSAHRQGLVFTEVSVNSTISCCKECLKRSLCHSFNYNRIEKICELNIAPTEEERSEALSTDTNYVYGEASAIYKGLDRNCMNHTCPDWSVCVSSGTTTSCDTSIDVPKECSGMPWSRPYSTYTSNGSSYLSVTDYTCKQWSEYMGGTTRAACRPNGEWEKPTIVCTVPPNCGQPPTTMGATPVYDLTSVGDVVTYSCKATWIYFSGSYTFTCGPNGEWTPTPNLFCIPTQCTARTSSGSYIYMGTVDVTVNGRGCQRFDNGYSNYKHISKFPYDKSMNDIANHCRPTTSYKPWCYYRLSLFHTDWEYCNVPVCDD